MPKQTAKFVAAQSAAIALADGKQAPRGDGPALYQWLADHSMAWDNRSGKWLEVQRPVDASGREQVSIFTGSDGKPTPIFRLRVMANPALVSRIADHLAHLFTVLEPPTDPYVNHKGPGARVYITLIFDGAGVPKKRGRAAARRLAAGDDGSNQIKDGE